MSDEKGVECPSCGGGGGGPFGRRGSAWDVETYTCPRCQGTGVVLDRIAVGRALAKAASPPADGATRTRIARQA
jgi:Zn-finger nucleic acid-binding protein